MFQGGRFWAPASARVRDAECVVRQTRSLPWIKKNGRTVDCHQRFYGAQIQDSPAFEMKFPRLFLLFTLSLLFAGCTLWSPAPKGKVANPQEEARSMGEQEAPDNIDIPTKAAELPPPTERGRSGNRVGNGEIDFSSPYGSVRRHGLLYVSGNRIVGEHGMPVSLAGNSFFWSQWQERFYNAEVVKWLKQDWKTAIIRVAMGIDGNGYLSHPDEEMDRVSVLVDAAIAADLYVIIDWHDHHAEQHTAQAVDFFQKMARKYGHYPNVLYEIFNEPVKDVSWQNVVKPYAEQVIAAIRAIDPDNMIIVGSPNWSQDVDVVAEDPIRAKNIAYSLHFYAGTHKQWLRDKALIALKKGLPLFVTEWGTCAADGRGEMDEVSTREWMDFMQEWGLSHCNWAVSDKEETASIVKHGASSQGQWAENELTPSGRLAREWMRSWAAAAAVQ